MNDSEKINDYHNMAEALHHIELVYQERMMLKMLSIFFEESFKIFQENKEEEEIDKPRNP